MKDANKYLAAWLRNAHAMEVQALTLLETQVGRLEDKYPEVGKRMRSRLTEILDQRLQLDRCRRKLGEDIRAVNDIGIKIETNLPTFPGWLSSDELKKHCLAYSVVEQIKAETYHFLSAAAQAAGEPEIARICDGFVTQGSAMVAWMWDQLDTATRERLLA
jgi:ferritin-like metal-binding protein YciE